MDRIGWDELFMGMAELSAQRATCLRRKVGAVLVKDNRVLAQGYNGACKGLKHCDEKGGCLREQLQVPSGQRHELCNAVHAEANLIAQCARFGISCEGATVYVNTSPCSMCMKLLINSGIRKIVTKNSYPDDLSKQILEESGIEYIVLK